MITKYATLDEYKKESKVIDKDKDINDFLELASLQINEATLTKIEKIGFDKLTNEQKELIKKATILEADYLFSEEIFDDDEEVSSYSIGGDLSVTKEKSTDINARLKISKKAYIYLKKTGLMQRMI